jgi:DME family drug/metabolite transporter
MIRGVAMVLAAAMLWCTTGTAQSFAPLSLSTYWVGELRLGVAALFFWPTLLISDRHAATAACLRRLPWPGIGLAAVCMCAYNLAFFAGVRACGVAIGTAVALGSGPVWAGLLQAALTRAMPSRSWWLGTTVAVALRRLRGAGRHRPRHRTGRVRRHRGAQLLWQVDVAALAGGAGVGHE